MALSSDRNTPRLGGDVRRLPMAAAALIYAGALVCRNAAGYAVKGATALNLVGAGVAQARVDNSAGSAGDLEIDVRSGVFRFANSSSGDAITVAEIGDIAWVVDDETVAKTSGSGTRSPAGIITGVDSLGVHVLVGDEVLSGYLATNKTVVQALVQTLVGTGSYYAVAPRAGRITKIWSVIEGVLTTGDATLTGKINGAAITNGVITITQAGSAAGDVDTATPTAANVVAAGDVLAVTVGGSNATASKAQVFFEITP
jgi:hypothetical protein